MADIASLSLEVKTDQLKQATAELRELPKAASAAERAAQKWSATTQEAGRSSEEFAKRVQSTIKSLEFERQQLTRNSTEQARFAALRRAGVSASSAEGQAITASVVALQAQKAALGQTSIAAQAYTEAWNKIKSLATIAFLLEVGRRLLEMGKQAIQAVGGLDELAEQAGISTRALQALQFAAVQNGVTLEQLDTGIAKFSQKIGEAATGSKPMIDALDALGVKVLDAQGKLRPTEDILQNVAKAILAIDDPAKRAAASVDFFGKAGTKFMPVLAEMAKGTEAMARNAEAMGATVSDVVVKRLDALSDSMERGALRSRNWAGALTGAVLIGMDKAVAGFERGSEAVGKWLADMLGITSVGDAFVSLGKTITKVVDETSVEGARWSAMFLEAFASMPDSLGKLFVDAWNKAKTASAEGLNSLTAWLASAAPSWMGITGGTDIKPSITPGGGFSTEDFTARIQAAGQAAAEKMAQAQQQAVLASTLAGQGGVQGRGAAKSSFGPAASIGTRNPLPTGAGDAAAKEAENQAKAYQKLSDQLEQTAKAQDLMTAASARGDVAFEAVKIHLEAQQKTLEIYGKVLDDTDPKLRKIEELLTKIATGKAAEAFNVATTELQKQNVILEAQIRLMNEAPEIQAREIALIKAKQEAEKAGTAVTQEMIDARTKAIEQNETLKIQQEDLKKAQDLWTEPLKQALQDIQKTAADAFEEMLSSGKVNFEELGNVFKKMVIRMAAEFLALATVRPVMSMIVNSVSPGMARQFGLDSGGGGGGAGMTGSLFGGGGGGLSDFFGQTLFGGSPIEGPLQPGAASLGNSGGLTVGGALGSAAGIGLGAYQLLKGGGTASTIGGAAGILGGGLGIAGALMPTALGGALGPIGMGIGLLGGILPMLFGGGTPEPPTNRAISSLNFSGGQFQQSGGSYGMEGAQLGELGSSMKAVLDLAKAKLSSSPYGLQQQSYSKGDFSNATTFITGPGGQQMQWGQSSDPAEQKQALDTAAAHVSHQIMLEVGSGISDVMREGLSNFGLDNLKHAFSMEELGAAVQKLTMLDDAMASFGKNTSEAEAAINAVDDSFSGLIDVAKEFNISASEVAKITAERDRQRLKATEGFTSGIGQALMEMKNPMQAALDANEAARVKDIVNNDEFLRLVTGYGDQRLQIEELYALRRNKIIEDANAAATAAAQQAAEEQMRIQQDLLNGVASTVSRVQDLIRQLTPGGDLANVDPRSQLAGLRATYSASFAQAIADPSNQAMIERAVNDARALAETSLRFNAGGADYERDRRLILEQQQALEQAAAERGLSQATDPDVKNLLAQLLAVTQKSVNNDNSAQRDADMATVLGLLARFLANGRTAA